MEQGEIVLNPLYRFAEHGKENGKIRGRLEVQGTLKNQSKLSMAGMEEKWNLTDENEAEPIPVRS
jgi:hypothetical protein